MRRLAALRPAQSSPGPLHALQGAALIPERRGVACTGRHAAPSSEHRQCTTRGEGSTYPPGTVSLATIPSGRAVQCTPRPPHGAAEDHCVRERACVQRSALSSIEAWSRGASWSSRERGKFRIDTSGRYLEVMHMGKLELCARGAAQAPHGSRELAPAPGVPHATRASIWALGEHLGEHLGKGA